MSDEVSSIVVAQDKGHNTEDVMYINKAEASSDSTIKVSIKLPDGVEAKDSLTVIVNGHSKEVTISEKMAKAKVAEFPIVLDKYLSIEDGKTYEISAKLWREGVESPIMNEAITVKTDLTAPEQPTVVIHDENGVIGLAEADKGVKVTVTPQSDAQVGETLSVDTNGDGTYDIEETITQDILDNGLEVTVQKADLTDGANMTVKAIVTDIAGNPSDEGTSDTTVKVDLTPPNDGKAPIVDIQDGVDEILNIDEAGKEFIDVVVSFDADKVNAGDEVVVKFLDKTETVTISDGDSSVTATFDTTNVDFKDATDYKATAVIKEAGSGNLSEEGTDTTTTDLTIAKDAPGVTIQDGKDEHQGTLTQAELDTDVLVDIKIPSGAKSGDTLKVYTGEYDPDNTPFVEHELSQSDITEGTLTFTVDKQYINNNSSDGDKITVSAVVADAAGNVSPDGYDTSTVDLTAPNDGLKPEVTIVTDSGVEVEVNGATKLVGANDGFINKAEYEENGEQIIVKVGFDKDKVDEGDVVHILNNNGEAKDIPIDAQAKSNGYVTTTFTAPAQNTMIEVKATLEDGAGNVSKEGADKAIFDTSDITSGTEVVIDTDKNNDTFINIEELKDDDNKIEVTVTLPNNTRAGDTLIVTGTGAGNDDQTIDLSAEQVTAGKVTVTFDNVPPNGTEFTATAQVSDAAGNKSNLAKDLATISTDSPDAPGVTIVDNDSPKDDYISSSEQDGEINVDIDLPDGTVEKSTLTVTDNHGHTHTIVLEKADITKDIVSVTFPQPKDGESIEVTAIVTDPSGNPSDPGTASAIMDFTEFTGLEVKITTDDNNDEIINKQELDEDKGQINVEVTIPEEAVAGDTIAIRPSGNTEERITLTQEQIGAGKVTMSFDSTLYGSDFEVSATISDKAGNSAGPVSDKASIDTDAPAQPTIEITTDDNDDKYINKVELENDNGVIVATVTLGSTTAAGDTLYLTDSGKDLQPITLTQADIDRGSISFNPQNPGEGQDVTVTAQVIDKGGNPSDSSSDTAKIDTVAPTIEISDKIAGDNIINAVEQSSVTIKGETTGVEDNQEVTLTITDSKGEVMTESATVTGDTWSVPDIDMSKLAEGTLDIKAEVTDKAGNPAEAKTQSDVKIEAAIEIDKDNTANVTVDEHGLTSESDTTEKASNDITKDSKNIGDDASFTLNVTNTDSGLTSNGTKVVWQDNSANQQELVGTAEGKDVIKVSVDDKGKYNVELFDSVDHKEADVADIISTTVNMHVKNNISGNEADADITVHIKDDTPTTTQSDGTTQNLDLSASNTNLGIILDVSPSMVEVSTEIYKKDGTEYTRMELAQESIKNLIDNYERFGDVAVKITIFSESAKSQTDVWLSSEQAKEMIDTIAEKAATVNGYYDELGGMTNYDAALGEFISTYATTNGKIEGAQEVTYFLTDGNPNMTDGDDKALLNDPDKLITADTREEAQISSDEEQLWTKFLSDNGITAISLGMGDVPSDPINPIAHDGNNNKDADGIVVTDLNQLNDVVQSTVVIPPLKGNVLENSSFGADEKGSFSVTVNGTTYTYDFATGKINNGTNGSELEVQTEKGSTIKIDMATGEYSYTANEAVATAKDIVTENIAFKIVDGDGDSLESQLTLNIKPAESDAVFAPKLTLVVEGAEDDVIDADEAGELKITGTTDAGEGQTVTITVKGDGEDVNIQAEVDENGKYEATVDVSNFNDGDLSVTAAVENAGGKETTKVEALTLNTTVKAPDAPTDLVITADADGNGSINQEEIDAGIKATVTLADSAKAGETLHVTFNGKDVKTVLTDENIENGTVEVSMPDSVTLANGDKLEISTSVSNGDVSSDVVTADAIPVSITPISEVPDAPGSLSVTSVEHNIPSDTEIKANVTLKDTAKVGDIIHVTFNGEEVQIPITDENIKYAGIEVVMPDTVTLNDGDELVIKATISNENGTSEAKEITQIVDFDLSILERPENIEIIADTDSDGKITQTEIDAGVKANVELADATKSGDVLNVSFNGKKVEITLTDADIEKGTVEVTMPKGTDLTNGVSIAVEATITNGDKTSESKIVSTEAVVDIDTTPTPEKPTAPQGMEIATDVNGDDKFNQDDIDAGVKANVSLADDAKVGDVLNVTFNGKNVETTLTQENIDDGTVEVTMPTDTPVEDGKSILVEATMTNANGTSEAISEETAQIDLTPEPTPEKPTAPESVEISADSNKDGKVDQDEIDSGVKANVSLADDTKASDVLNVSFNGKNVETTLTQENIDDGTVEVTMPKDTPVENGKAIVVEATITNVNGTSETKTAQSEPVDLSTTPEPEELIEVTTDTNGDGKLDSSEFTSGDEVDITVNLPEGIDVGDLVLISVNSRYQPLVTVTQEQFDAGEVTIKSTAVDSGSDLNVHVRAYNMEDNGITKAIDEEKELQIESSTINVATGDNDTIEQDEAGNIAINGSVGSEDALIAVVTIEDKDGKEVEVSTLVNNGDWNVEADVSSLAPGDLKFKVSTYDKEGKEVGTTASTVALIAAAAITQAVAIDTPIVDDGVVDADDKPTISGTSEGIEAGSTIAVTITEADGGDEAILARATVGEDGKWETDEVDLSTFGDVELNVQATLSSSDGTVVESKPVQVSHDTTTSAVEPVQVSTDGDDTIEFDLSKVIDGGEGEDTLVIKGNDSIDLTTVDGLDGQIENVEAIELNGGDLTINADAILDMSDNENTIFKIEGTGKVHGAGWEQVQNPSGVVDDGYMRYQGLDSEGHNIKIDIQDTIVHTDF